MTQIQERGAVVMLEMVKNQCLAIPEMPVFKSQRRRASEEKEGLIGEVFGEVRAGQRGKSGRRKDEVRQGLDGS